MVDAIGLLLFTLFAGALLGIFILKPYMRHTKKRSQVIYFTTLILLFFAVGTTALYISLGAPLLVTPVKIYHELMNQK